MIIAALTAASLSWSAMMSGPCAPEQTEQRPDIVGVARDPDSGAVLYCEWHNLADPEGKALVRYVDPEGVVFAEKHINYKTGLNTPEIEQLDKRSGELHRVERQEGDRGGWLLTYRESEDVSTKQTRLPDRDVDVIDAGFDNRVRAEWPRLVDRGERVAVQFASTVYQRALPLRMVKRADGDCGPAAQELLCFWVEPNNFVVRLFVDQLRISYDQEQRLRRFEGVVNIQNAEGEKQSAVIDYAYHPDFPGY